jgi:hypothetical protein
MRLRRYLLDTMTGTTQENYLKQATKAGKFKDELIF